jgi:hypothetical protein
MKWRDVICFVVGLIGFALLDGVCAALFGWSVDFTKDLILAAMCTIISAIRDTKDTTP